MEVRITKTAVVVGGTRQTTYSRTVTAGGEVTREEEYPAAKVGVLTVRTDANTGSLTMASGHGIITGDKIDIYWDGGYRANMTVGTVASLVVPIDLGGGIDLPAAATAITAMVVNEELFALESTSAEAILVGCSGRAPMIARFVSSAPADIVTVAVVPGTEQYLWVDDGAIVNPITADVAKVYITHGDSTAARTPLVMVATA